MQVPYLLGTVVTIRQHAIDELSEDELPGLINGEYVITASDISSGEPRYTLNGNSEFGFTHEDLAVVGPATQATLDRFDAPDRRPGRRLRRSFSRDW